LLSSSVNDFSDLILYPSLNDIPSWVIVFKPTPIVIYRICENVSLNDKGKTLCFSGAPVQDPLIVACSPAALAYCTAVHPPRYTVLLSGAICPL
jgi:hypothetical protein